MLIWHLIQLVLAELEELIINMKLGREVVGEDGDTDYR
jgi:hypothetical protein